MHVIFSKHNDPGSNCYPHRDFDFSESIMIWHVFCFADPLHVIDNETRVETPYCFEVESVISRITTDTLYFRNWEGGDSLAVKPGARMIISNSGRSVESWSVKVTETKKHITHKTFKRTTVKGDSNYLIDKNEATSLL